MMLHKADVFKTENDAEVVRLARLCGEAHSARRAMAQQANAHQERNSESVLGPAFELRVPGDIRSRVPQQSGGTRKDEDITMRNGGDESDPGGHRRSRQDTDMDEDEGVHSGRNVGGKYNIESSHLL